MTNKKHMAGIIRGWTIRGKLKGQMPKLGGVYFKKSQGIERAGIQRGTTLKKTLINIATGKTEYRLNKALKEAGVTGWQQNKRKRIIELAFGKGDVAEKNKLANSGKTVKIDYRKDYLSEEQVKRNLSYAKQERVVKPHITGLGVTASEQPSALEVRLAGIRKDIGPAKEKTGSKIGFASQYKNSKLPNSSTPKIPQGGVRPIGL